MTYQILHGSNLDILPTLPDNSVDAIVTDPPYGLSDNKFVAETITRWINGERDFIPDGKGFMGKSWDAFVPPPAVWDECLRVLKPGGHLLAFFGSRTQDIGALSIRLAGFEIRDSIAWMYGSGFPKSLDISKAIDKSDAAEARAKRNLAFTTWMRSTNLTRQKATEVLRTAGVISENGTMAGHFFAESLAGQPAVATAELFNKLRPYLPEVPDYIEKMVAERTIESQNFKNREVIGQKTGTKSVDGTGHGIVPGGITEAISLDITAPATPEAQQWEGWGTALKPAFEPIVVARKPLIGTVAENVLTHGTGGLNIDGSRIGTQDNLGRPQGTAPQPMDWGKKTEETFITEGSTLGRWPANVILDPYTAELLDEQSGISKSTAGAKQTPSIGTNAFGDYAGRSDIVGHNDSGGASRFFYVAKASRRDRNEGVNLCSCDKLVAWENEGQRAKHQTDTDQLAERVTGESGTQNNADFEWSMSLSGSESEVESQKAGKSITLTETSSTTTSATSLPLTQSHTNASTQDANSEAGHGGSLVSSAKNSSQLEVQIGISAEKAGHSTADADLATSKKWLNIKSESALWCSNCFGLKGGHPTVKPTDLMRYLVKLVTPPGGTVLDPFTGSGSTGKAAILEGFDFIGIELTDEYLPIIEGRLAHAEKQAEQERQRKDEALF